MVISSNVQELTTNLNELLDTQSKKALWMHVLNLLPVSHQAYVRKKVDLPTNTPRTAGGEDGNQPSTSGQAAATDASRSRRNRILTQSDDEFFVGKLNFIVSTLEHL